jgi:protein gp37
MRNCALPHRLWYPRREVTPGVTVGRDTIDLPAKWPSPSHIFVMPTVDLFLQPQAFIKDVFAVMNNERRHEFQIPTRHPERARALSHVLPWPKNVWLGAELDGNANDANAIAELLATPAKVRFAVIRPKDAVVPIASLSKLSFVIVESDHEPDGIEELGAECEAVGVRLFAGTPSSTAELRQPDVSLASRRPGGPIGRGR